MKGVIMRDVVVSDNMGEGGSGGSGVNSSETLGVDPTARQYDVDRIDMSDIDIIPNNRDNGSSQCDGRNDSDESSHLNSGSSSSNSSSSSSCNSNSSSSSSSSSGSSSNSSSVSCNYNGNHPNIPDEDGILILDPSDVPPKPLREPIPPHKVVMRKRGDQEQRIELYGAWQTVPYEVHTFVLFLCVFIHYITR